MKKRDLILIGLAIVIIAFLWAAPEETTPKVPQDETHLKFHTMAKTEGKKAAEKFCKQCHDGEQIPFPAGHPDPNRCLFCHKIVQQ